MLELPILNSKKKYKVNPTKIIALGLNYHSHINESASINSKASIDATPKEPILFPKTPNVLIGHEENIIIPKFLKDYKFDETRIDYEAELAIIINKKCKNVPKESAFEYIFGYTCINDVSQRNFQFLDKSGWFRGKSLDTFGPIGPILVPHKDIKDPQNLNIKCWLNKKMVQDSNTREMIFFIPEIIAFITKNFTLEEGDIIATGTPGGVGQIKNGDIVEVEIENIGILRNRVIEE